MPVAPRRPLVLRAAALPLAGALLLAGCGSGDEDETATPAIGASAGASSATTPMSSEAPDAGTSSEPSTDPAASAPAEPSTPAEGSAGGEGVGGPRADGTVRVIDQANAFQVDLPKGWVVLEDPSRSEAAQVLGGGKGKPTAELVKQAQSAFAQGAKLVALESGAKTFAANVNIVIKPAGGLPAKDIMRAVPTAEASLKAIKGTVTKSEEITLGEGPAARIDYRLTPAGADFEIVGRQIYAIRDDNAYIVTISIPKGAGASDVELIADSLFLGRTALGS